MASADELIVKIGADFDELRTELRKAGDGVNKFGDDTKKAGKKSEEAFKLVSKGAKTAAAGVSALTTATIALTKKQLDAAKATVDWADRLAISRSEFSRLAAVGARFGASIDDVGDSIKDLNERIADAAAGNKTYEEALNRAGLSAKNLIDLPLEEQFIKVADAIGRLNNAGEQNFVTAELMADAGFRLLPVFRQGEKAIRAMGDQVVRTGEALNKFQLERLAQANQSMVEMGNSATVLGNALLDFLAPGFKEAAKWMGMFTETARDLLNQSLSGAEDRLAEVREELKKYDDLDAGSKILNARTRGAVRHNARLRERNMLLQEQVQLEKRIASLTQDAVTAPATTTTGGGGGSTAVSGGTPYGPDFGAGAYIPTDDALLAAMQEKAEFVKKAGKEVLGPELADGAFIPEDDFLLRQMEENERYLSAKESFLERELGMEQRHRDQMQWLWEAGARGRVKIAQGMLGELSSLMQSNHKGMFEVGKKAAQAETIISTISSAQKSYDAMAGIPVVGPALGAAAAGVAIAAGTARLQAISSTSFGSSSIGGGGGTGAGGAGAATQEAAEPTTQVLETNVTFAGDSISQEQFRGFVGGLNEAIDDGVTIGRINA